MIEFRYIVVKEIILHIQEFFAQNKRLAVGFSGGVDSAYLLAVAKQHGVKCVAYYVDTALQPRHRLHEVIAFAERIGVELRIINYDIFSNKKVLENDNKRCYHCKRAMFAEIAKRAKADGFNVVCDGTNASDDTTSRAGVVALNELGVISPLAMCGITKTMIRTGLYECGVDEYNKVSYSCLATRIPNMDTLTADKLQTVEQAENIVSSLGYRQFRVNIGLVAKVIFAPCEYSIGIKSEQLIKDSLSEICDFVEILESSEKDKQFFIN